ncbi:MAG: anthranilate synthase component I family protein [Candidatus Omnitrophica bacterium]|nr:anthranilate synthase component I family protein [Candidatus Omnitrophota bacterium]
MATPSLTQFLELSKEFSLVPIVKEVTNLGSPSELLSKVLTHRYPFLLESARCHPLTGRYSFLGWDPYLVFKSKGDWVWLEKRDETESMRGEPLRILRRLLSQHRSPRLRGLPPFAGGAVGYLSYEIRHFFEKLPNFAKDDLLLPDAFFLFFDRLIAFDHLENKTYLLVNVPTEEGERGYPKALEAMEEMEGALRKTFPPSFGILTCSPISSNMSETEFKWMVERAKAYIRSGDIFQANLSQRLHSSFVGHPYLLYEALRQVNPSPFASFFDFGDFSIVSSSPERLLKKEGEWLQTRPIAGTRPRGKDSFETLEKSIELLLSDKERAEHLMLIDLERNDLGRICDYGTVHVNEMMTLEEYSHVIHIVSNIVGKLKKENDLFGILRALFPGGTVTGVPKVRCMEIIDELEPVARGIYTGSIGYLGFNGEMDLNIVIRTFILKGDDAYIQVGSGIVADSDPLREYEESLHKAQALVEAMRGERSPLHAV